MKDVVGSIIGGARLGGSTSVPDLNPADPADVVVETMHATADDARDALRAARAAHPLWASSSPLQRAEVLERAAGELERRASELGVLLAREEGKTLAEAVGEVRRSAQSLRYYAGVALHPHGQALDSVRSGIEVTVTREPLGVVSVITPWNFPMAIPAWKIAPALAFGNSVVFKPADLVPASGAAFVDVLNSAGLPPGVLNLVLGRGSIVGDVLSSDKEVDAVTFTGSVSTGERILRHPAAQLHRKVQLELGGKNPLIVLDDADLPAAVEALVQGGFGATGQRCTASSIAIVTAGIHDRFVTAVQDRLRSWQVGDGRDDATDMGPVVDESQLLSNLEYLAVARREGADVVGGGRIDTRTNGFFMAPALVLNTGIDDTINREEVFGPVVSVVRVKDYEEALASANASTMNLSAGVFTRDLAKAVHFRRNSKAGLVMINLPTVGGDFNVPFGGRGLSSHGPREQGLAAVDFFTVSKSSYLNGGGLVS